MRNDNLNLWKLKHGEAFLNSFMKCADYVNKGKKCKFGESIKAFVNLGLLEGIPNSIISSIKNVDVKLSFTNKGVSLYDQLIGLLNRGIIYREENGNLNWINFQFV